MFLIILFYQVIVGFYSHNDTKCTNLVNLSMYFYPILSGRINNDFNFIAFILFNHRYHLMSRLIDTFLFATTEDCSDQNETKNEVKYFIFFHMVLTFKLNCIYYSLPMILTSTITGK